MRATILIAVLVVGCGTENASKKNIQSCPPKENVPVSSSNENVQDKLYGMWSCPPDPDSFLDGEWGPTRVVMHLKKDGTIESVTTIVGSPGG
jgi:hypothetical protein